MRMQRTVKFTLVCGLFAAASCSNSTRGPENAAANRATMAAPAPAATVPAPIESNRITVADAKKMFDDRSAVFVDVRSIEAYKMEHIKGALNIPLDQLDASVSKLPKGKKLIIYCS